MKIIYDDCQHILNYSPVDWNILKKSRLLITGGTGYYGKWLLKSFLHINSTHNLNAQLYVVSRSPKNFLKKYPEFSFFENLFFIAGDVRNFSFPNGHFDYIIHAATEVATNQEKDSPEEMLAVARDGTKNIIGFAKYSGARKLLLTSSGAVYGTQPSNINNLPETYNGEPNTVYGIAKKISEDLCFNSKINCTAARCYASVGPWLRFDIQYAIGNFIRDAMNMDTIIIKSDGRPYWSYLYAADLMCWLWTILLNGKADEDYNVGSEDAISISELATTVSECCPPAVKCEILGKPDFNIPAPRYIPNTEKARKELGLKQSYSLTDSIKRTIQWAHQSLIL